MNPLMIQKGIEMMRSNKNFSKFFGSETGEAIGAGIDELASRIAVLESKLAKLESDNAWKDALIKKLAEKGAGINE